MKNSGQRCYRSLKNLTIPVRIIITHPLLLGSENLTCFSGPSEEVVVEPAGEEPVAADAVVPETSSVAEDDIPAKIMPY